MHKEQKQFCQRIRTQYPEHFEDVNVLDVGSLDINGNNRYLFTNQSKYIGLDIIGGRNVDVVKPVHTIGKSADKTFDTVISTEMLEHDIHWEKSLYKMYKLVKSGGLLIITCATTGRKEHGTFANSPVDSPATNSYYKNISKEMFMEQIIQFDFEIQGLEINEDSKDLYFYGIKK